MKIEESGMTFGEFDELDIFQVENFTGMIVGSKAVEFVWKKNQRNIIVFVEAKSSISKPNNKPDFDNNINEIYRKFLDSLLVLFSIHCDRNIEIKENISTRFHNIDWKNMKIYFHLVVKDFKQEWLPPISDALRKNCKHFLNIFKIPVEHMAVINESMAIEKGLVISKN